MLRTKAYTVLFINWLLIASFCVACSGAAEAPNNGVESTIVPTAEPPTAPPATSTPSPTSVPATATSEPTSTPSPEPTAMTLPATAAFAASPFPELVWLPYGSGSYGAPILTVQAGQIVYEPAPATIEAFFDYSRLSGLLAYGSQFWQAAANGRDSVTDLWVYDYGRGENEMWLPDNVGRAVWAPVVAEGADRPLLAVALHNGTTYDLALMTGPGDATILAKTVDPYYAWSPDGEQLAFIRQNQLFVVSISDTSVVLGPLASNVYAASGWTGDAPVWLTGTPYLLYADAPFMLVTLDGTEQFTPIGANGPLGQERPFAMLWSRSHRQLIAETQGMFGSDVQIYQLGDDLRIVTEVIRLEDTILAGWLTPDETVVLVKSGDARLWSLAASSYINP